jgi:hypothetical protein
LAQSPPVHSGVFCTIIDYLKLKMLVSGALTCPQWKAAEYRHKPPTKNTTHCMEINTIVFLESLLVIFFGATLQAATGLGAGLVIVPFLALI